MAKDKDGAPVRQTEWVPLKVIPTWLTVPGTATSSGSH